MSGQRAKRTQDGRQWRVKTHIADTNAGPRRQPLPPCNADAQAQAQAQAQATCAAARLSWRPLKGRLRRAGVLRAPSVAAEGRKELEVIGSSSSGGFILCSPDSLDASLPAAPVAVLLPWAPAIGCVRLFAGNLVSTCCFADRCGLAKGKEGKVWAEQKRINHMCLYIGEKTRHWQLSVVFVFASISQSRRRQVMLSVGEMRGSPVGQIISQLCLHRAIEWPTIIITQPRQHRYHRAVWGPTYFICTY